VIKVRFDVDDASLRDTFLRTFFFGALDGLRPETPARWGRMTAQQMVEHLLWAFDISTGRLVIACPVPTDQVERMKRFLFSNRPTPPDFMNPLLEDGLPALRFSSLKEAKGALMVEVDWFLEHQRRDHDAVHVHPIFGPIGMDEWSRTHFKHGCHHLLQFGLIGVEP
jgi:oxepin-CoA hydrolase / 3-oxo-5,6-dehydrosuberyl-CoA semialdehyde dehydrogenase